MHNPAELLISRTMNRFLEMQQQSLQYNHYSSRIIPVCMRTQQLLSGHSLIYAKNMLYIESALFTHCTDPKAFVLCLTLLTNKKKQHVLSCCISTVR